MSEATPATPRRVLVTGAAGAIGVPVTRELRRRGHFVRGFDMRASPDAEESHVGNLEDQLAVRQAVESMDVIVHLAATPDDAPFLEDLVGPNVVGLFNILDAARHSETAKRVVLASSGQTLNGFWRLNPERLATAADAMPTNHYGLTKVWAEQMGEMYARCFGLAVLGIRIGWFTRNYQECERMASREHAKNSFFSHNDAARFFALTVEAALEPGTYHTLFALSRPTQRHRVDMEPSRRVIGYEPRDVFPQGLPFAFP